MRLKITNLNGGPRTLRLQKFVVDRDGKKSAVGISEFVSADTQIDIDMPEKGGLELTWQPAEQDAVSPEVLAGTGRPQDNGAADAGNEG